MQDLWGDKCKRGLPFLSFCGAPRIPGGGSIFCVGNVPLFSLFSFSRALSHRPTASKLVPSSPPTSRKKKLRRETCTPQDFFSPTHHNLPFSFANPRWHCRVPSLPQQPKGREEERRKKSISPTNEKLCCPPPKVCPLHVQRNKDGGETSSFLPSWVLNAGDHHLLRKVCAFAALL